MAANLAARGRHIVGPIEQPHLTPWSTALRIPTAEGPVWFKATGPGTAHEGPLLETFRRLRVARVVLPLAIDPDRAWLLFDDAGPTLRAVTPDGDGDRDLASWERILREYAALQRSVEGGAEVAAMLAAGTPDGRPDRLPGEVARLLDDDRIWALITPEERVAADAARERLRATGARLDEAIDRLGNAGVAASIQHDDLHGGNIVVGPAGDRFFDWGDAVVAHPFTTLTVTFNSIAHKTGRDLDDPDFDRLRDAYLEAWTDVAPRAALTEASVVAQVLGCIGRSLGWERAIGGLVPDDMEGHGDSIAGWLMELDERLDRVPWRG